MIKVFLMENGKLALMSTNSNIDTVSYTLPYLNKCSYYHIFLMLLYSFYQIYCYVQKYCY